MENVNPIYLFIFLFSHSQCAGVKDCVKEKKEILVTTSACSA